MQELTQAAIFRFRDAERPRLHSHAERGNDQGPCGTARISFYR
jgi:hypothetical protein